MRALVLAAALGAAGLAAGAAMAQARGQDSAVERRKYNPADAERTMSRFAACLVSKQGERYRAERFLRMTPATGDMTKAAQRLATPICMPSDMGETIEIQFNIALLRASLFSALYQRDYGKVSPPDLASVRPLVVAREFDGDAAAIPPVTTALRILGDCAARNATQDVHALLRTDVRSTAEGPAMAKVLPILQRCLPEGRELRFSRSMLRGALAEALYKLRRAPASPSAGTA